MNTLTQQKYLMSALSSAFLLIFPVISGAQNADLPTRPTVAVEDLPEVPERTQIRSSLDRCDLIGATDIFDTSARPLRELADEMEAIRTTFLDTSRARTDCYNAAISRLRKMVLRNQAQLAREVADTTEMRRQELDEAWLNIVEMRKDMAAKLLASMLDDIEQGASSHQARQAAGGAKNVSAEAGSGAPMYYVESDATRRLIREDMALVLEAERRELEHAELSMLAGELDFFPLAKHKLAMAQHLFSRALLAYEDMGSATRQLYALSRLVADFRAGSSQFSQVLAFDPELSLLTRDDRRAFLKLQSRVKAIARDLDSTLNEMQLGIFEQNVQDWMTELYGTVSNLSASTRKLAGRMEAAQVARLEAEESKATELAAQMEQELEAESARLEAGRTMDANLELVDVTLPTDELGPVTPVAEKMSAELAGNKGTGKADSAAEIPADESTLTTEEAYSLPASYEEKLYAIEPAAGPSAPAQPARPEGAGQPDKASPARPGVDAPQNAEPAPPVDPASLPPLPPDASMVQ